MTGHIDIQNALDDELPIDEQELIHFASLVLEKEVTSAELTIRIVPSEEMIYLNNSYRKINKTTNVLAFLAKIPEHIELDCPLLGDVIICPDVLLAESIELHKTLKEHWALIVIHGVLHLLGYDHIKDTDAEIMQKKEIQLLAELGYSNPYANEDYHFE